MHISEHAPLIFLSFSFFLSIEKLLSLLDKHACTYVYFIAWIPLEFYFRHFDNVCTHCWPPLMSIFLSSFHCQFYFSALVCDAFPVPINHLICSRFKRSCSSKCFPSVCSNSRNNHRNFSNRTSSSPGCSPAAVFPLQPCCIDRCPSSRQPIHNLPICCTYRLCSPICIWH